jgi:hypothetical protein
MTQKLSDLIRDGLTGRHFSPIKTKVQVRSAASRKAWKVRKRMKAAREAAQIDLEEVIAKAEAA